MASTTVKEKKGKGKIILLNSIQPDKPGKELTLTHVYDLADQGLVKSASFKEMDSNVVLVIYKTPPTPVVQPQPTDPAAAGAADQQPIAPQATQTVQGWKRRNFHA